MKNLVKVFFLSSVFAYFSASLLHRDIDWKKERGKFNITRRTRWLCSRWKNNVAENPIKYGLGNMVEASTSARLKSFYFISMWSMLKKIEDYRHKATLMKRPASSPNKPFSRESPMASKLISWLTEIVGNQ